ncbi:MAG TPA: GMC family oxidoreductase N-terminal domain-containing protein [Steroidobacteraceae bacterium]|nr:GMC family oxidoreductase N-terminal domain-containing protein [Steroidobacteraceae bacterium]
MRRIDYIVVGGGSAGCVLAARLSEDPSVQVLLLEAGDDERKYFRIAMPLAWRDAFRDPRLSWGFETEPEPFADGRRVPAPRGKVLGGSNSVNGLMYMRGCPADYDDWAKLGLPDWSYEGVLPYFRRSEANWRGASRFHGATGPLTTARYEADDHIFPRIIETAEALGFRHLEDFHAEDIEGFALPDCNYHAGERASTVARFLRPAMSRPNLDVRINTHAECLLFDGERCVGVRAASSGGAIELRCEREVILAAGAFNSPQLLQLSGIGDPRDLEPHGIRVRHALPGVGANLQDHQSLSVDFAAQGAFCFDRELRLDRLLLSLAQWKLFRNGVMSRSPISAQGLVRTAPHLDRPDLQMLVAPVSIFAHPWFPGWRKGWGHTVSNSCVLLHPGSRGKVSLRSADPRDKPRIQLNLLQAGADREGLRNIVKFVRRFFATAPATELVARELSPGPEVRDDAAIDAWLRANVRTAMHPVGTCAMGVDGQAVVDGQLRVRGLSGLRVADASIMPAIVGGNTNAPTIMIAEKAVDMIRGPIPRGGAR